MQGSQIQKQQLRYLHKVILLLDLLVVRKYQFSWVGGHTILRLFLCLTSQSASCAAPEGNKGSGPPPLENHKLYSQVIWVSNKTGPPPPRPLESVGPPLKSSTITFLWNKPPDPLCINCNLSRGLKTKSHNFHNPGVLESHVFVFCFCFQSVHDIPINTTLG